MFVLLFYCHTRKLIIQCSNISCHLSCDKINNSSNWYQTNGTFLCWMRNILCYVCGAKSAEFLHFISNGILFYQLVYRFIIFIHFQIICKEGFCTATRALFSPMCFFSRRATRQRCFQKRQETFNHFYALSFWSCALSFSRESLHRTCSALAKFQFG